MAKKRKKIFQAGREARRVAREIVGNPPPQRVVQDKRAKSPKHKKPLLDQIERENSRS